MGLEVFGFAHSCLLCYAMLCYATLRYAMLCYCVYPLTSNNTIGHPQSQLETLPSWVILFWHSTYKIYTAKCVLPQNMLKCICQPNSTQI